MALIKKANDLIQAQYQLSKNEQRLILHLLSTIQRPDKDFKDYEFSFADLVNIIGMRHATVYAELSTIAHNLTSNPIIFEKENKKSYCNWCAWFEIDNNKKTVTVSFHPKLKPYLLQLKGNFTRFHLKNVSGFRSAHSFRIYEICKQYQSIKKRKISMFEFKDILDISDKYSQISALKAYVINPALKDINEQSDLLISVKYKKTRRSITDIEFTIENKLANCQTEKQEDLIIADVNKQAQTQKTQAEQIENAQDWRKKWNALSLEEQSKWGNAAMGYGKYRSCKGVLTDD